MNLTKERKCSDSPFLTTSRYKNKNLNTHYRTHRNMIAKWFNYRTILLVICMAGTIKSSDNWVVEVLAYVPSTTNLQREMECVPNETAIHGACCMPYKTVEDASFCKCIDVYQFGDKLLSKVQLRWKSTVIGKVTVLRVFDVLNPVKILALRRLKLKPVKETTIIQSSLHTMEAEFRVYIRNERFRKWENYGSRNLDVSADLIKEFTEKMHDQFSKVASTIEISDVEKITFNKTKHLLGNINLKLKYFDKYTYFPTNWPAVLIPVIKIAEQNFDDFEYKIIPDSTAELISGYTVYDVIVTYENEANADPCAKVGEFFEKDIEKGWGKCVVLRQTKHGRYISVKMDVFIKEEAGTPLLSILLARVQSSEKSMIITLREKKIPEKLHEYMYESCEESDTRSVGVVLDYDGGVVTDFRTLCETLRGILLGFRQCKNNSKDDKPSVKLVLAMPSVPWYYLNVWMANLRESNVSYVYNARWQTSKITPDKGRQISKKRKHKN